MCTAVTFQSGTGHYFGRNLDLEYSYDETVTITPRSFPFTFEALPPLPRHYAMIGTAHVAEGCPLYYDATNEKGLSMAALSFPHYAAYLPHRADKDNVAPFELIWWVLGQCATLAQARALLEKVNVTETPFSSDLPLTPLHWLVADRTGALAVEPLAEGLKLWEAPAGVLTNSPPFDFQMLHLAGFRHLGRDPEDNSLAPGLELPAYSRGTGAVGLPGDLTSPSRFVRAAFVRGNVLPGASEEESVGQFFHILGSVAQQKGCVRLEDGQYEFTVYSSCCNTDTGVYYYTTYENSQITAVDMRKTDLDGGELTSWPMITSQQIHRVN